MSRLGLIKQTFKSARIEIKAFLRRQEWKEALIFFCFILLAFGFWLLQSLQQEYEIDIRIPVKYKNVPPDISFTETPPEAITVKVKDKGSVLLNYSFGRSFAPIEANMKTQSEKSGKLIINRKDIENEIKKHLIATTSLLSFEPQHIDAAYASRRRYQPYSRELSKQMQVSKFQVTYPLLPAASTSMPAMSFWTL